MSIYTESPAPQMQLLKAWCDDPATHPGQLVHAVAPGRHVAQCGVQVTVTGRPWPDAGSGSRQSRCSICAYAVEWEWVAPGPVPTPH